MTGSVLQIREQSPLIESNRCCCVKSHPDLQFDFFVLYFQSFHREIHSNCVRVTFGEDISGLEARDDAEKGFLVVAS